MLETIIPLRNPIPVQQSAAIPKPVIRPARVRSASR
jgi:hypothetical protein